MADETLQTSPLPPPDAEPADPAATSLADALRVCFRLLAGVMCLGVVMFLLTGVQRIQSGQMGIKYCFGRKIDVVQPGLAYTWPYPVGRIDVFNVGEQTLKIVDFWMSETPEERTVELSKRVARGKTLLPGWDGALLTGDSCLLHAELECSYVIQNPVAFKQNVGDANEMIRSAICAASIHAAALRTAEGLMTTEKVNFKADVTKAAQKRLDSLGAGIMLTQVRLGRVTWPLRALPEYYKAQRASQEAMQMEDKARKIAAEILRNAAGSNYRVLVGEPAEAAAEPAGLIQQYAAARGARQNDQSVALGGQIDQVMLSDATGGEASKIIAEAIRYKTETIESVKGRVDQFKKMLPKYLKAPQYTLDSLWAQSRQEILSLPGLVKWMISPQQGRTVIQINTPPEVTKDLQKQSLQTPSAGGQN